MKSISHIAALFIVLVTALFIALGLNTTVALAQMDGGNGGDTIILPNGNLVLADPYRAGAGLCTGCRELDPTLVRAIKSMSHILSWFGAEADAEYGTRFVREQVLDPLIEYRFVDVMPARCSRIPEESYELPELNARTERAFCTFDRVTYINAPLFRRMNILMQVAYLFHEGAHRLPTNPAHEHVMDFSSAIATMYRLKQAELAGEIPQLSSVDRSVLQALPTRIAQLGLHNGDTQALLRRFEGLHVTQSGGGWIGQHIRLSQSAYVNFLSIVDGEGTIEPQVKIRNSTIKPVQYMNLFNLRIDEHEFASSYNYELTSHHNLENYRADDTLYISYNSVVEDTNFAGVFFVGPSSTIRSLHSRGRHGSQLWIDGSASINDVQLYDSLKMRGNTRLEFTKVGALTQDISEATATMIAVVNLYNSRVLVPRQWLIMNDDSVITDSKIYGRVRTYGSSVIENNSLVIGIPESEALTAYDTVSRVGGITLNGNTRINASKAVGAISFVGNERTPVTVENNSVLNIRHGRISCESVSNGAQSVRINRSRIIMPWVRRYAGFNNTITGMSTFLMHGGTLENNSSVRVDWGHADLVGSTLNASIVHVMDGNPTVSEEQRGRAFSLVDSTMVRSSVVGVTYFDARRATLINTGLYGRAPGSTIPWISVYLNGGVDLSNWGRITLLTEDERRDDPASLSLRHSVSNNPCGSRRRTLLLDDMDNYASTDTLTRACQN